MLLLKKTKYERRLSLRTGDSDYSILCAPPSWAGLSMPSRRATLATLTPEARWTERPATWGCIQDPHPPPGLQPAIPPRCRLASTWQRR